MGVFRSVRTASASFEPIYSAPLSGAVGTRGTTDVAGHCDPAKRGGRLTLNASEMAVFAA